MTRPAGLAPCGSCTTSSLLSIVIVSVSSVPGCGLPPLRRRFFLPERFCKVTESFRDRKIFREVFFRGAFCYVAAAAPAGSVGSSLPESECKVTHLRRSRQILRAEMFMRHELKYVTRVGCRALHHAPHAARTGAKTTARGCRGFQGAGHQRQCRDYKSYKSYKSYKAYTPYRGRTCRGMSLQDGGGVLWDGIRLL